MLISKIKLVVFPQQKERVFAFKKKKKKKTSIFRTAPFPSLFFPPTSLLDELHTVLRLALGHLVDVLVDETRSIGKVLGGSRGWKSAGSRSTGTVFGGHLLSFI